MYFFLILPNFWKHDQISNLFSIKNHSDVQWKKKSCDIFLITERSEFFLKHSFSLVENWSAQKDTLTSAKIFWLLIKLRTPHFRKGKVMVLLYLALFWKFDPKIVKFEKFYGTFRKIVKTHLTKLIWGLLTCIYSSESNHDSLTRHNRSYWGTTVFLKKSWNLRDQLNSR